MAPGDPGSRVPGSIQRLPWITLGWLQLPGSNDRAHGNPKDTTVPWVLLARREQGPLSPGDCFLLLPMNVQHVADGVRVLSVV